MKMKIELRRMSEGDRAEVIEMMRAFYSSPAVYTDGSAEIFNADIDNCLNDSPYLDGYIIERYGDTAGYVMIAKSFSTEFGKRCAWIEDIYLKDSYRGMGIGSHCLALIEEKYPDHLLRLEVEEENEMAVHVYEKSGFDILPYMEMKKQP